MIDDPNHYEDIKGYISAFISNIDHFKLDGWESMRKLLWAFVRNKGSTCNDGKWSLYCWPFGTIVRGIHHLNILVLLDIQVERGCIVWWKNGLQLL